jgi:hypothetical protein
MTSGQRVSKPSMVLQVSIPEHNTQYAHQTHKYMTVNYLKTYRLQWGKPDKLSLLPSSLSFPEPVGNIVNDVKLPPYFTADAPRSYISIIRNDWPYSGKTPLSIVLEGVSKARTVHHLVISVPSDVEHWLIWTTLPIFPPIPSAIATRVAQDGLWGFTGSASPPPSPSTLPTCLPSLAEWGVTLDSMVISPPANAEEQEMLADAAREIDTFVRRTWVEEEWETAWFVNPPVGVVSIIYHTNRN